MKRVSPVKVIATILLVILVLLVFGTVAYYFLVFKKGSADQIRAEVNSEKPKYESVLTKSLEDYSGNEKEFALYLYSTACDAFKDCENCAIIEDYVTTTSIKFLKLNLPCQGCRFTVKSGTEYYYADYSSSDPDNASLLDMFDAEEDTLFAKRSYTDISKMDYLYTEKVLRPTVEIDGEGKIKVDADWNNLLSGYPKKEETPIFHSSQEGTFQQTEMIIEEGTVKDATVSYNEELEYYTVTFILDVNNPRTSEKLIDNLRSGLKNGNYTSITKVYQIWNNGYFRLCESMDYASNGAMELKLDFKSYFKYGEADCNPENYRYFPEIKEKALAENNK